MDRYGNMPEQLENLIEISRIKMLCIEKNVIKISQKRDNIVFTLNNKDFDMSLINKLIKLYKNKIKFSSGNPYITLKIDSLEDRKIIREIKEFIKNL